MPIDKDGIIRPKEKNYKLLDVKSICLIITTCVSVLSVIFVSYQSYLQKIGYEKEIEELELEKTKYENMLKENDIQIRSSYIVCHINYIESLFNQLGEENNIKILANDITDMFYDSINKNYLHTEDFLKKDPNAYNLYDYVYPEIIFLKLEVISNRYAKNTCINFIKISEENNIYETFRTFGDMKNRDYYRNGDDITIKIGDLYPNEIILIPVVLKYSEGHLFSLNDDEIEDGSIYRLLYVPQNISCYDIFYNEEIVFDVRDVLEDSLITEYYYEEFG